MKLSPKQIISERYEIIDYLGTGGMANVYCANDTKLDRKVTFKVLKEEFFNTDSFKQRFIIEARAVAKLSHINIANVYDVGVDGNICYIVMEYIDGYTLKEIINQKGAFNNEEILGVSIQIASAIKHAHDNNIIHKDIKPQNILITKDGIVKVTDFGIAKEVSSNTITTETIGSVHYFSPEQARGGFIDFKTDIYSFGIVIYEMATAKLPFDGEGTVQLAMKHINEPLPDISKQNDKISLSIQKIVKKATEKVSSNRYQSIDEMISDMKKALVDSSGDFVKENNFSKNLQTLVISEDEIKEIRQIEDEKYLNNLKLNEQNKKNFKNNYKLTLTPKNSVKINKKNIDKKSKKSKYNKHELKTIKYAIFSSLGVIFLTIFFTVFVIFNKVYSEVPNFVGQKWDNAIKTASNLEVYIVNSEEQYSDEYEKETIIGQTVKPGKKIKKGDTIGLVLSLGTNKFKLPDFVGKDISRVYEFISEHPINLSEEYVYNENVDIGKIVKQEPAPNSLLTFQDEVVVYISKGTEDEHIIVPNILGMSVEEAKARLQGKGLNIGKISKIKSSKEKGTIISQSKKAGTKANKFEKIDVVISDGETTTASTTNKDVGAKNESTTEITTNTITSTSIKEPIIKKDKLVISPIINDDATSVEVKVIKVTGSGQSEVYLNNHSPSDFPLTINVSGSEPTEYQLYINGVYQGTETKTFD